MAFGPSFRLALAKSMRLVLSTPRCTKILSLLCLKVFLMQSIHPQLRAATRLSARALQQAHRQASIRCLTTTFADPEVATAIEAGQKVSALHTIYLATATRTEEHIGSRRSRSSHHASQWYPCSDRIPSWTFLWRWSLHRCWITL